MSSEAALRWPNLTFLPGNKWEDFLGLSRQDRQDIYKRGMVVGKIRDQIRARNAALGSAKLAANPHLRVRHVNRPDSEAA